ncbi:mannose-1-phosphate guanyltransferase [Frankia sp. Cppng1_Ct_nod]|uniref:mannose-1-phosphate guanyltransferase n=1 Tax=Frankia sp. Cppng1_Ct_nod TaxID=2897162 RepID=UPI001041975F|nr:mannose-1-phosphate guanyltransferase [Frankia sp. Cppng1_Ct_nod]
MAGGEGTRLRPMTANQPKPLLPVVNRPIMEHVLRLLKRHGFNETVVTVQFLAAHIRTYFGDGDELGMHLSYATETTPLGTAGSVKNAQDALRHDSFLVISGDALTDIDLTSLVAYHRKQGALVTVALKSVPDPLEFGIVITSEDGRIARFLEKPTWGQVFSDTVNTGIYVMEPEALDHVPVGESVDWSSDVFPRLVAAGAPVYGHVVDGYWEDVGTIASFLRVQGDVLEAKVDVEIGGFEVSPGVWAGRDADVHPEAVLSGPLVIGDYTKIESGAELREFTVVGNNVVVKQGAFLHRAVVQDNALIGPQANLRGCVIGKSTDVLRAARVEEGAVIGDECVIEEEAFVSHDVKVYPFKTIEAGAVVNTSVIWESRGQRSLFGPRGVSGLINVEITPELVVRLASAYATTLRKGSTVTTARDGSRAARALKRAVISALTASAIDVRDLEVAPMSVTRFDVRSSDAAGGVMVRTTPGDAERVDIIFVDAEGSDLSPAMQRKLDRVVSRQEFRRAFPAEIGELRFPARTADIYTRDLLDRVDTSGLPEADLKLVIDTAGGAASLVLPTLLGRLGVDALTVNGRLDETFPARPASVRRQALDRLGALVASSRAAFGVQFDHAGERITIVDERGDLIDDERALLVFLDLVAAENRGAEVALPVTTTRIADQVTRFHGLTVRRTSLSAADLTRVAGEPNMAFAADARGGFVVPEFAPAIDGLAAFVKLAALVARTRLTLSAIDARIPAVSVLRRSVSTPWAVKGTVMRRVVESVDPDAGCTIDTTDGVRVVMPDGAWVLVLPDPAEAVTHLWAEGEDPTDARKLLDHWSAVVEADGKGASII